jgi:hypothetical protein
MNCSKHIRRCPSRKGPDTSVSVTVEGRAAPWDLPIEVIVESLLAFNVAAAPVLELVATKRLFAADEPTPMLP